MPDEWDSAAYKTAAIPKPGSIHARRVTYQRVEAAFDRESMPEKSRQARDEVLNMKWQRDKYGSLTLKVEWDPTVGDKTVGLQLRPIQASLLKNSGQTPTYNYRAERLDKAPLPPEPKTSKFQFQTTKMRQNTMGDDGMASLKSTGLSQPRYRTAELTIHPDLGNKPEWDSSTTYSPKKESKSRPNEQIKTRKTHTPDLYSNPTQVALKLQEKQRVVKESDRELRSNLAGLYGPDFEAVLEAKGRRDLRREMARSRQRPTRPAERVRSYYHTGCFSKSVTSEGLAWSCCLAESKDARGCNSRLVNTERWNTQSI